MNKGAQERQMTEQLQSLERQVVEKTATAEQLQKQNDEMRAQLDSTQQDKDKKKLVFFFLILLSRYTGGPKEYKCCRSRKCIWGVHSNECNFAVFFNLLPYRSYLCNVVM